MTATVSIFGDRASKPTRADLEHALAGGAAALEDLEGGLRAEWGGLDAEWKYYGAQAGWTLAYRRGKRTLMHLIPRAGEFTAVVTLGPRAVAAARASDLSADVKAAIEREREYAEGRSVRIPVRGAADARVVEALVRLKLG